MDIENQVTTLEQSKRLKELGVEIKSFYAWIELPNGVYKIDYNFQNQFDYYMSDLVPALTTEEVLNEIPDKLGHRYLHIEKLGIEYFLCYEDSGGNYIEESQRDSKNLTQALASMLIWLIENKHIK